MSRFAFLRFLVVLLAVSMMVGCSAPSSSSSPNTPPPAAQQSPQPNTQPSMTPGSPSAAATDTKGLRLVNVTSPSSRGAMASITVKATPGAQASISVIYKSGPSSAAGLETKTVNSDGTVSWSWKVGSKTTPGVWRVVVTSGGQTLEVPFEVR